MQALALAADLEIYRNKIASYWILARVTFLLRILLKSFG